VLLAKVEVILIFTLFFGGVFSGDAIGTVTLQIMPNA
jgi:hypothetical protein